MMEIKPEKGEEISWKELRKRLNYLSKKYNITFRGYFYSAWKIDMEPKEEVQG